MTIPASMVPVSPLSKKKMVSFEGNLMLVDVKRNFEDSFLS